MTGIAIVVAADERAASLGRLPGISRRSQALQTLTMASRSSWDDAPGLHRPAAPAGGAS
jgi:hypothetical protein